tara:strand:+ start:67 stop:261 length:195 start_codon:yes stop_codon:yes gene_type:complete
MEKMMKAKLFTIREEGGKVHKHFGNIFTAVGAARDLSLTLNEWVYLTTAGRGERAIRHAHTTPA